MVRSARHEDIPKLLEIADWYVRQINPELRADKVGGAKDLRFLMASKTGCVFVAEVDGVVVGGLAGQVLKQSFVDCRYATDVGFAVLPKHPIQAVMLVRRFVQWARKQPGVKEITLQISSGLANADRVGRMYERLGLRHMGACFTGYL